MALNEAEKRRRRFLKAKKDAGGDIESLQAQIFDRDFTVQFDKEGNILSLSQEKIGKKKGTFLQTFTREQVEILKGKNTNLYRVVQDSNIDTVYSIELKPVESVFVRTEQSFVSIIEENKKTGAELLVYFKDNKFIVEATKKVLNKYKNIDPALANINGSKELKFYFTSINDPHFLIHNINISLKKLLSSSKVETKVPPKLNQCSVYTLKLFDKYVHT
jgi:dipeptidyl aminopeptidase/acylaminoacyl peptidase